MIASILSIKSGAVFEVRIRSVCVLHGVGLWNCSYPVVEAHSYVHVLWHYFFCGHKLHLVLDMSSMAIAYDVKGSHAISFPYQR
ncbi:hypothetical protein ACOSP7_015401 [Xanthoceras sorbifolium]